MAFLCRRFERLMIAAAAGQASDAERLALEEHLAECESCRALHASDAPLRRLKGRTRWHMWLKSGDRQALRTFVRRLVAELPFARDIRVTVDVDPMSAL